MKIRKRVLEDLPVSSSSEPISRVLSIDAANARPEPLTALLDRWSAGTDAILDEARSRWSRTASFGAEGAGSNRSMRSQ